MVNAYAAFLVDTGSGPTGIHRDAAVFADLAYGQLENPFLITGGTGSSRRFTEPGTIASADDASVYHYDVDIWVSTPQDVPVGLPCILGQDILKDLRLVHDPTEDILTFQVRRADRTITPPGR